MEEADELLQAETPSEAVWETADLLYFALVKLASQDGTWSEVEGELKRRTLTVTRRAGNAKTNGVNDGK